MIWKENSSNRNSEQSHIPSLWQLKVRMVRTKKVLTFPSCFFFGVVAPLYLEEPDCFTPHYTILLILDCDWLSGCDMSTRVVSLQATQHPRVPSNISSIATHGRCGGLQLRMVVGQACKPHIQISQGWEMTQCRKVLTFLWSQTSSRFSLARPSSTHDLRLWTPRLDASCLHKSLVVTLRLSSSLGYDELSRLLIQQGQLQR
jgi:hypothetical protein